MAINKELIADYDELVQGLDLSNEVSAKSRECAQLQSKQPEFSIAKKDSREKDVQNRNLLLNMIEKIRKENNQRLLLILLDKIDRNKKTAKLLRKIAQKDTKAKSDLFYLIEQYRLLNKSKIEKESKRFQLHYQSIKALKNIEVTEAIIEKNKASIVLSFVEGFQDVFKGSPQQQAQAAQSVIGKLINCDSSIEQFIGTNLCDRKPSTMIIFNNRHFVPQGTPLDIIIATYQRVLRLNYKSLLSIDKDLSSQELTTAIDQAMAHLKTGIETRKGLLLSILKSVERLHQSGLNKKELIKTSDKVIDEWVEQSLDCETLLANKENQRRPQF